MKRITDISNSLRWVNIFTDTDYVYSRIAWSDVYAGIHEVNDIIAWKKFIRIYRRDLYLK